MKALYQPSSKDFVLADVPSLSFLMIDGKGDPNTTKAYGEAIEALYAVAYTLKFMSKKTLGKDYTVPPLEGLWWAEDMTAFTAARRDDWLWTMMIMQPVWITAEMVSEAMTKADKKKLLPALPRMRFENFQEGLSLQIMHIGSYADEAPTIRRLHEDYMPTHGYMPSGKHHEVYLGDPRKTATEKLKTVIRQPVKRVL
jgi:hypothetical protein